MNINLYHNHVGYITDLKLYSKSYICSSCNKMWKTCWAMKRHAQTCKEKFKYVYKGGVYTLSQTIFQMLDDVHIVVPPEARMYPYFITYDLEAYLSNDVLESTSLFTGRIESTTEQQRVQ